MPRKQVAEAEATTTKRQRHVRFPCIVCNSECGIDTIKFSHCMCWVHRQCVPLTWVQLLDFWMLQIHVWRKGLVQARLPYQTATK